jgi:hypothetical protein
MVSRDYPAATPLGAIPRLLSLLGSNQGFLGQGQMCCHYTKRQGVRYPV